MCHEQVKNPLHQQNHWWSVFFYLFSNGFFYPSMNGRSWTGLFGPSMNKIVCQEPLFSRSWTALWHCSATCVHSPLMNTPKFAGGLSLFYRTSSPLGPLPKKGCLTNLTKNKVPEFSSDFGDLSLIDALRGPKTPSNRQVLRLFLFLFLAGNLLQSAAELVVEQVLRKLHKFGWSHLKELSNY